MIVNNPLPFSFVDNPAARRDANYQSRCINTFFIPIAKLAVNVKAQVTNLHTEQIVHVIEQQSVFALITQVAFQGTRFAL